ncbi:MAG: TAT-variant-translocated molybdopterin oxidoreductase [Bacteroidota bacterium]
MSTPKYWRGLEELEQSPEFLAQAEKEFDNTDKPIDEVLAEATEEAMSFSSNRRDFLKVLGFGMTAATLSACAEGPVKKAIPYVSKPDTIPDEIIPGVANFYATTTPSGMPALAKTREGRPIKLEGNPDSSVNKGGLSARDQATILDLYDTDRLRGPKKKGNQTTWDVIDQEVAQQLAQLQERSGSIRILTHTLMSPTLKKAIGEFMGQYQNAQHITFEPVSNSAIAKAHEIAFGQRMIPTYAFDKAMEIVSIDADFLGTWINPVGFAADYATNREPDKPMSRHTHFESLMSITGGKADLRIPMNPSQLSGVVLKLHNAVAQQLGKPELRRLNDKFDLAFGSIQLTGERLAQNRGKSLVVSGSNDVSTQLVVIAINQMLGNYGTTLDHDNPSFFNQGDDEAFEGLMKEMEKGSVDALFVVGANPVYNSFAGAKFGEALKNVGLTVSFANKEDETSVLCTYTAPDHNFLESWGDVQQSDRQYSLVQPTIYPIFDTRQVGDTFLKWAGAEKDFQAYLKENWESDFYPASTGYNSFTQFWNETLRQGVFELPAKPATTLPEMDQEALRVAGIQIARGFKKDVAPGTFDLVVYPRVGLGDGTQANNPWLQELPDPIQRVAWDNYVTVPLAYAQENGLKNEDVLQIAVDGKEMFMPVIVQPGQAKNTLGISLGFGRTNAGRVAKKANGITEGGRQIAGTNAYVVTSMQGGGVRYYATGATVTPTGTTYPLALTQTFNTLYDPAKGVAFGFDYDRSEYIVEETYTEAYADGTYKERVKEREAIKEHLVTLWDTHFEDPETQRTIHWKMAIDLNKCTGCGACVVACNAENNVPVVGKTEVRNRREMHWMRIDRYYTGDPNDPDVVFQPMLCQHCDNAPCETVCPVLATIHSNEGLNQMTYNRCIGTRYCANNCPYKVRRFNWYNYWNDEQFFGDFYTHQKLGRLVLNPDVTVRFRGVMEKCSFCVQRLQEGKLKAKVNARSTFAKPEDGQIQTACQQSCPTGAIVFGDANDPNSEISNKIRHQRSYSALEEVKALPSVQYQALVRNRTHDLQHKKDEAFEKWRKDTYGDNYQAPKGHGGSHDNHDGDHKEEAHKEGEHA